MYKNHIASALALTIHDKHDIVMIVINANA